MTEIKSNIITIDGDAGSGKSTIAHNLAKKLGWVHVNTGAIYRTFALIVSSRDSAAGSSDISSDLAPAAIELAASQISEHYYQDDSAHKIFLDGKNITEEIHTRHISNLSSVYAQNALVREKLLPIQRKIIAQFNGVIVDGRDMGTVVFPFAPLKIFLTASAETRARRRLSELQTRGLNVNYETLLQELRERDLRDSTRNIAPSIPASDAIIIDSSEHSVDEIVDKIFLLFSGLQESRT